MAINCVANVHNFSDPMKVKGFEEVNVDLESIYKVFGLTAEYRQAFKFLESSQDFALLGNGWQVTDILPFLKKNLQQHISFFPFDDEATFQLNAKINTPKKIFMNEALAIYLITFHLGSLVRYKPQVLETMLSTKDAWILERFIKSAPLTFMRYARNMVDDIFIAYGVR